MLGREPQVTGELLTVGEQAADRGGIERGVLAGESVHAGLHGGYEPLSGLSPRR